MEVTTKKSGIEKSSDGAAYIPASKRADGSVRKEIRVRPGYTPPEDVETYKNRNAQAFQPRGSRGVPGAEDSVSAKIDSAELKSKNVRRREAARKKAQDGKGVESGLTAAMERQSLAEHDTVAGKSQHVEALQPNTIDQEVEDAEREKKVRNLLKKLKAVTELKEKKSTGEKLSHDQLLKIGKESELIHDLQRLGYQARALEGQGSESKISTNGEIEAGEDG